MPANQIAHDLAITEAMGLLASGAVNSKEQAARAVGIGERSLSPDRLALRAHLGGNMPALLDVVGKRNGEALSMRQVLSEGAISSLEGLASVSQRIGQEISRTEAAMIDRCQKWLTFCDKLGLFKDSKSNPLSSPSEDVTTPSSHLSVESWLRSHKTIDGSGVTLDRVKAQVIDTPTTEPTTDSPAKVQAD